MSEPEVCTTAVEWILVVVEALATIGTSIPLSIWAMHQYRKHQSRATPLLFRLIMVFYCCCIVYMFCLFLSSIVRCFSSFWLNILFRIQVQAYIIRWALVLAIYMARLNYVFKNTAFEISKKSSRCLTVFYVLCIVFILLVEATRYISYNFVLYLFGYFLSLLFLGSFNITLCVLFLKRLNKIRADEEKDSVSDGKIFGVLAKYTILSVFGCATTWAFILWLCTAMFMPRSAVSIGISNALAVFDVYSDIVCMTFTFAFAERGYHKLCGLCDRKVKMIYGKDENQVNLHKMVMVDVTSNSSNAATSSNATKSSKLCDDASASSPSETSAEPPTSPTTPTETTSIEP